jgi:hypothetical protein
MSLALVSLVAAVLGLIPMALVAPRLAAAFLVPLMGIAYAVFYLSPPATVGPLLGDLGVAVICEWIALGIIGLPFIGARSFVSVAVGIGGVLVAIGISLTTGPMFNAATFANKIGPIETRDWTSSVQPKDVRQMRLVPEQTARYVASKSLSQAGAIGSQFHPDYDHMTLQQRDERLLYVIPLDYNGYAVWSSTAGTPGWIEVDAQDPQLPPRYVSAGERPMVYTPGAYFGTELTRHIREAGVRENLGQARFIVDAAGQAHWMIVAYAPSQGFSLPNIVSILDIDPVSGEIRRHAPDAPPAYADLIYSGMIVSQRLNDHGQYSQGAWNAYWAQNAIESVDSITLVAGNDGRLMWVSGISQPHRANDSLVAMVYTDVRTGKSVRYRVNGGATDEGIIRAVNANPDVRFRHLRASTPQTYNVEGVMTSMVPLTTEVGAFQGVAFAEVANPQDVAYGETQEAALNAYKLILLRRGQDVALETAHGFLTLEGTIDRIAAVPLAARPIEFTLTGRDRIFTASANDYPGLGLAKPGDHVTIKTVDSASTMLPIRAFENHDLVLHVPDTEKAVRADAQIRQDRVIAGETKRDLRQRLDALTPAQIEALDRAVPEKP